MDKGEGSSSQLRSSRFSSLSQSQVCVVLRTTSLLTTVRLPLLCDMAGHRAARQTSFARCLPCQWTMGDLAATSVHCCRSFCVLIMYLARRSNQRSVFAKWHLSFAQHILARCVSPILLEVSARLRPNGVAAVRLSEPLTLPRRPSPFGKRRMVDELRLLHACSPDLCPMLCLMSHHFVSQISVLRRTWYASFFSDPRDDASQPAPACTAGFSACEPLLGFLPVSSRQIRAR